MLSFQHVPKPDSRPRSICDLIDPYTCPPSACMVLMRRDGCSICVCPQGGVAPRASDVKHAIARCAPVLDCPRGCRIAPDNTGCHRCECPPTSLLAPLQDDNMHNHHLGPRQAHCPMVGMCFKPCLMVLDENGCIECVCEPRSLRTTPSQSNCPLFDARNCDLQLCIVQTTFNGCFMCVCQGTTANVSTFDTFRPTTQVPRQVTACLHTMSDGMSVG